ncbi:MAG TPA: protoporphyrinogen oxidase HemJ [Azospirillaceae bacterium]|nr:protoporphyrinogen oxidase HemJ [Azospirillaceae bacterium]
MAYLWIKALHVVAIISWMAGLLYLPRLFVYHADTPAGTPQSETFKIMERRLLRGIMNPAMIVAWAAGLTMIWLNPGLMQEGWLHAKLTFVVLLTVSHMAMAKWRKDFEADRNTRPAKFYRVMNEVPTLFMLVIVAMVIVRPF